MEKLFKFFAVFLFAFSVFNFNPALTNAEEGFSFDRIITLTNSERREEKIGSLAQSEILSLAAQMKAEDMARYGYFSHTSPKGRTPWHWFAKAGYDYSTAGENLAVNMPDAKATVSAWMNSSRHRANILDSSYTETGLGISYGAYNGQEAIFIVQLFASPKSDGGGRDMANRWRAEPSDDFYAPNISNVLGAHNSSFSDSLRLGSSGELTRQLQTMLNQYGYSAGLSDGKFGYKTHLAVVRFQADRGLVPDGVVGPMTWALL